MKSVKTNSKKITFRRLFRTIAFTSILIAMPVLCTWLIINDQTDNNIDNESSEIVGYSNNNVANGNKTDLANEEQQVQGSIETNIDTVNVDLVVVDASQYDDIFEVRSYANAIEDGTCTFVFTQGEYSISRKSAAIAGASTSSCNTSDFSIDEFDTNGTWQLQITYISDSGSYRGEVLKDVYIEK